MVFLLVLIHGKNMDYSWISILYYKAFYYKVFEDTLNKIIS